MELFTDDDLNFTFLRILNNGKSFIVAWIQLLADMDIDPVIQHSRKLPLHNEFIS